MLFKTCTACNIEQDVTCFAPHKTGKYGVTSVCKACACARSKAYYHANKEAVAVQMKAYQKANKEAIGAYIKAYQQANKEAAADYGKAWRQANPDIMNAYAAKRRASKLLATPSWADKEAIAGMYQLAALFNSTGINLHVDHIVPLKSNKVSGLHCEANLQLLSATENIIKGNRYWDDMWTTA